MLTQGPFDPQRHFNPTELKARCCLDPVKLKAYMKSQILQENYWLLKSFYNKVEAGGSLSS